MQARYEIYTQSQLDAIAVLICVAAVLAGMRMERGQRLGSIFAHLVAALGEALLMLLFLMALWPVSSWRRWSPRGVH